MISPATTGGATPAAALDGAPANRAGLAASFDGFLKLLTAQLEHQDPLSPLDTEAFTSQLVQFSSVEQAIKTNDGLERLIALVRSDRLAGAAGYLGAEVEATGNAVRLGPSGSVDLAYRLPDAAAAGVTITVTDAGGRTVHSAAGATAAGERHRFTWDGRDAAGRRAPAGLYRIDVAATGPGGGAIAVDTAVSGTVDGVEFEGDRVMLSVDGVMVPLDAVTALRRPAAAG